MGYRKAKRRGGLAVHDHLEFCRKLYREIVRHLAAQSVIDIGGGATKEVYHVGSVGEQTAVSDKLIEHARKTALARLTPAESQCEFAELLYRSSRPSLALNGRTFPSAVPKWVLQAVSHRFNYHVALR